MTPLLVGVAADLCLGDPRWLPHPVVGIGKLAAGLEKRAARTKPAGALVWLGVVGVTSSVVWWTCEVQPWAAVYWIYSFLAVRSLDDHALAVMRALRDGDLAKARTAVSLIVGRETAGLEEREVARAALETVAENLNDGVIAPLFWFGVGGPAAMAGYKAINTMDSMFGYRNDKYRDFGWCAARMDDVASWIPARITAALIWLVAALVPGMDARASVRCTLRDAHRQPSPNSGYPEAAAAGALGIQLGGLNRYPGGIVSKKELLGDNRRPLDWQAYQQMRILLYGVTLLAVAGLQWR
ncbi:adenosylcobinamide-phosphate synthase CbiB [Bryobacter aggregatus]|uniref:adenosylcobinamide-phosphate synthase CbiB n=1 Tax=Bryobacter aggregatus TaxID=360054 RepID=UPI0004E26288|nr:adenosylcobinamide-phosphate synthase CbiB [Bryobacter aggregatus]